MTATNLNTALHKTNCIAALVMLSEGTFDETPTQKYQRTRLIAEIVATNDVLSAAEAKLPDAKVEQGIAVVWERLWKKTHRELVIRGAKV